MCQRPFIPTEGHFGIISHRIQPASSGTEGNRNGTETLNMDQHHLFVSICPWFSSLNISGKIWLLVHCCMKFGLYLHILGWVFTQFLSYRGKMLDRYRWKYVIWVARGWLRVFDMQQFWVMIWWREDPHTFSLLRRCHPRTNCYCRFQTSLIVPELWHFITLLTVKMSLDHKCFVLSLRQYLAQQKRAGDRLLLHQHRKSSEKLWKLNLAWRFKVFIQFAIEESGETLQLYIKRCF